MYTGKPFHVNIDIWVSILTWNRLYIYSWYHSPHAFWLQNILPYRICTYYNTWHPLILEMSLIPTLTTWMMMHTKSKLFARMLLPPLPSNLVGDTEQPITILASTIRWSIASMTASLYATPLDNYIYYKGQSESRHLEAKVNQAQVKLCSKPLSSPITLTLTLITGSEISLRTL